jgi:RimJ/RimL family protein N-acetyltransferase
MKLLPLDNPALVELAAGWLARRENYQWLDFGGGRQLISPPLLKIMAQRDTHFLRLYTGSDDRRPIGLLGLNSVDRTFRSATFWGLSGDKAFRERGYSTPASARFIALGFRQLGLRVMHTWVADGNPSQRIVERLGFRFIGRQRLSHVVDGRPCDRLLYDLLEAELCALEEARRQRAGSAPRAAIAAG